MNKRLNNRVVIGSLITQEISAGPLGELWARDPTRPCGNQIRIFHYQHQKKQETFLHLTITKLGTELLGKEYRQMKTENIIMSVFEFTSNVSCISGISY